MTDCLFDHFLRRCLYIRYVHTETDIVTHGTTICDIVIYGTTICDIVIYGTTICAIYSKPNHIYYCNINYMKNNKLCSIFKHRKMNLLHSTFNYLCTYYI